MHIAQYYPWVYLPSGIERVILEVCRRSRFQHTILTNRFDRENTYAELSDQHVVELQTVPVERNIASVLRAAGTILFQQVDLSPYDALIVHCDGLGDLMMMRNSDIPAVCYCHTPLRPVFDPHYRSRAVQRHGKPGQIAFKMFSHGFKFMDRICWNRYRHIFFNSQETYARARNGGLLDNESGDYEVLHPGIDWEQYRPSWKYDPYFLVAGRIMWTKNIEVALQGFLKFKEIFPEFGSYRLIITGHVDAKSMPYLSELREIAAGRGDVDFVIFPSDRDLWKLYADSYALLFPAFNEDWGIVPLEANTFGKPVIATNCGGPLESQIDSETGFLVSPRPDDFAEAMGRLASDPLMTRRMGEKARENARQYDWKYFVNRIDSVLEKVIAASRKEERNAERVQAVMEGTESA
ncbi:MAG: glycosyltransferase family 4 protein [Candidatus Latescibacterota bacterium]